MDDLVQWWRVQLDDDERIARAASGATVVGEPGAWQASPLGDEWEVSSGEDEELLVALRPGLPRPPDVMSGYWGAVVSHHRDDSDPDANSPMPAFEHAARHDPARVLAEVEAKRAVLRQYTELREQVRNPVSAENRSRARALQGEIGDLLRLLALPYADRVGYRDEWRP